MLDEHGHRKTIIPAEVKGFFRKHRTWTQAVLISIFLFIPWIKIGGEQAILLDLSQRKFAFFGLVLFAHDAPNIFFLFGVLVFGLALVTALWGRVWCGWACPQTVFIDAIYRRIEILVEGNYIQRRALEKADLSVHKISKKILKWFLFFIASSLIAHSFTAYFVGGSSLALMITEGPSQYFGVFVFVSIMTAILLFDFGWFREQFCIIMCPYGKFQSVLLDNQSLTVMYDEKRGEPRKGRGVDNPGDCVSCNRCVQVCPTGIDIRNGVQLECIACTACIDACDEIMTKVNKPKGLIRYTSLIGDRVKLLRPRTVAYLFFILVCLVGLATSLSTRQSIHWSIIRAKDSPYTVLKNNGSDQVLNHFILHLKNQSSQSENLVMKAVTSEGQELEIKMQAGQSALSAFQSKDVHIFILAPLDLFSEKGNLEANIYIQGRNYFDSQRVRLLGPFKKSF